MLAGGYHGSSRSFRKEILSFNSSGVWTVVGNMKEGKSTAAAAVFKFNAKKLNIRSCL